MERRVNFSEVSSENFAQASSDFSASRGQEAEGSSTQVNSTNQGLEEAAVNLLHQIASCTKSPSSMNF
ncbi:MAG: hypothetical protein ACRC2R_21990 [Xenococcaceae cyanobacterium]